MEDNEIDNIVDKTIELIANDDYEYDNGFYMDKYFLNKKDYMKLLINGEITNNQREIHDLIEEYQLTDNKNFMIKLVQLDSYALRYASKELMNNKEFMIEAIRNDIFAIEYASVELLQNDEELKRLYEEYCDDLPF